MIYYTGDMHGDTNKILYYVSEYSLTSEDVIVILGDVGVNYFGNDNGDKKKKRTLNKSGVPILCIHGNHEMRPESIGSYKEISWHDGNVYVEEEFPNLLFAKDGEIYDLDGKKAIAIGGAYSVDKFYRLSKCMKWFADEQPSEELKMRVIDKLDTVNWNVDIVLTHTCPAKYIPTETFLPMIDQSTVDNSTEHWLNIIEDKLSYQKWYCGHWHIDKKIDKIRFIMDDLERQM